MMPKIFHEKPQLTTKLLFNFYFLPSNLLRIQSRVFQLRLFLPVNVTDGRSSSVQNLSNGLQQMVWNFQCFVQIEE
jgi:hypothetical protein